MRLLAVASATIALLAAPAVATAAWQLTPLKAGIVAEDGTATDGSTLFAPDGSTQEIPRKYRMLGLTDDGRAFLWYPRTIHARTNPGVEPPAYTSVYPNNELGFYAWLSRGGLAATTISQNPIPNLGVYASTPGERGYFDDAGAFVPVTDLPSLDGYVAELPPNAGKAYLSAWYADAVSGGGWVVGHAGDVWNWKTVLWRSRTGTSAPEILDEVKADGYQDDRIIAVFGVDDAGDVLYRARKGGATGYDRLLLAPGARVLQDCTGGTLPYGGIAPDGSLLRTTCFTPPATFTTFTVESPSGTWTYTGEGLYGPIVLNGGLVMATRGLGTPEARTVLVNKGRILELAQVFGALPGTDLRLVRADKQGRFVIYLKPTGTTTLKPFLASRKTVVSVVVTSAAGAPLGGVPVTASSAVLRSRQTVRTNRQGVARIPTTGGVLVLSVPNGCLPGPRGCATSTTVRIGLTDPAPTVAALAGKGARTAPIMATGAQPVALKAAKGKLALAVRCLKAKACTGTATLRLAGLKAVAGRATVRVGARAAGTVAIALTRAGKGRLGRKPVKGTVALKIGARTVTARVRVAR